MNTNSRFDLRDNSANPDKTSLHGIQDIVPLQANCGSKNLNIMAAKKKKNIGFFRGLVPSFCTAGPPGISSNKGTELGNENINLSFSGKTIKVPQEHTYIDGFHFRMETFKFYPISDSCETDRPSDAQTTQENNSSSGQTISGTGKPAVQVSKNQIGSNNFSRSSSSSSSGGDERDDGQRQNVPSGSCQQDSQCSLNNSEQNEQQPEEQSPQGGDLSHNQESMSLPASVPSDTGDSQAKTGTSNQKVGQTPTDEGKPAGQASRTQEGSTSCRHSRSGSGGDDGGDDRKRNLPTGGCQNDSQCEVEDLGDTKPREQDDPQEQEQSSPEISENEQQPEEQGHQGGDLSQNQESMSLSASVPSDTGDSQDKTGTSNQKVGQTPTDEGKPAGQASRTQEGSTSCRHSSSGSGGDDGGDDRDCNLPTGGCQNDSQCEVEDLGETKPREQDNHQEQGQSGPEISENSFVSAPSCDGAKRSASQGLRIDVPGARMIVEGSFQSQEKFVDSQSAVAGGLSLSDQFDFHHPEADLHKAEQKLQQAFTCRRHLNSENEWKECGEACCQEIREYLSHSQNCRMRVLGGCKRCICYKELLVYHASRCLLPMGACVVQNCDNIREYMKENRIPDKKWPYQLDNLFFNPSLPATPTSSPEKGDHIDQHFIAQLLQEVDDTNDADNLSHQSLISDGSLMSSVEESLRKSSGVGNRYHVDKPPELLPPAGQQSDLQLTRERSPDAQVTRGPTANAVNAVNEQVESTVPLSAACMPDVKQTVKTISLEEKGEVIWPLDQQVLSVGEDGSYVEGVHWRQGVRIGRGSSGRCHLCQDAKTGFLFAIKRIRVRQFQQTEIDIWGSISGRHPNILELYGAVKHKEDVVIFMEYMEGGSVEEYGKLNEDQAVYILGKVISAVEFMHSQRLLHRDIKDKNVLLDETGQKVKLADFGLTVKCDGYLRDNQPKGTVAFMAPEVCRSEQYSLSVDIWGLMCTFYKMLVGKPPWREASYFPLLFEIGTASQPPQPPPLCSPGVKHFFSRGFVLKPSERATAAELLRHPVFKTDLTKIHIKDSQGNLVFTIRERPSTSYGHLGEEHHGNIASVLQLDAFTLTRDDGTPLNVRREIGFEEQTVRVVRAHDTDNWQPYRWRVDVYGRVEQFSEM